MTFTVNIVLEKLITSPLKLETRHACLLLPDLFNIVVEILATAIRKEKKKRHPNWKAKSKTGYFT